MMVIKNYERTDTGIGYFVDAIIIWYVHMIKVAQHWLHTGFQTFSLLLFV